MAISLDLDLAARRDAYALAARLLAREIDAPLYRALTSAEMDKVWRETELSVVDPHLRSEDEGKALESLAVEFCRLFIGPLPQCVPYESSQREDALLGGRARKRFEDFMQRHGLELDATAGVASPDHVAVEVGVLAQLYGAAADEANDEADRRAALAAIHELLSQHLLAWAPRFFAHLAAQAERAVYRTVGVLGQRLLEEEREIHAL